MVELIWSPRSVQDLEDICAYIANDSLHYARIFAQKVHATIENLTNFPNSGRMVPEYQREDIREHIMQNYRIVYRVKPKAVEIVAIVHGARLLREGWLDG